LCCWQINSPTALPLQKALSLFSAQLHSSSLQWLPHGFYFVIFSGSHTQSLVGMMVAAATVDFFSKLMMVPAPRLCTPGGGVTDVGGPTTIPSSPLEPELRS